MNSEERCPIIHPPSIEVGFNFTLTRELAEDLKGMKGINIVDEIADYLCYEFKNKHLNKTRERIENFVYYRD